MSNMRLQGFRVTDFRSVHDSGWIEVDEKTNSFIGVNESGKTNLILPLWKLNPAKGGDINAISDFPRSRFAEMRAEAKKPIFICAQFSVPPELASKVAALTDCPATELDVVEVSRDFSGARFVHFPKARVLRTVPKSEVIASIERMQSEVERVEAKDTEEGKSGLLGLIAEILKLSVGLKQDLKIEDIELIAERFANWDDSALPADSPLSLAYQLATTTLREKKEKLNQPAPGEDDATKNLILEHLPKFVYYSNYGNLDSEIYLPHVIQNMSRDGLGTKLEAQVRTLRVLFDFVKLKPQEILDLGKEVQNANNEQISQVAEKKKERMVLLDSAAAHLTREFREWWKQGKYVFKFAADGDHFRIWVSDDKRPEPVELENRSSGLQWFLSFFLIFIVESKNNHRGAILLLDEPGLTLHPLAQRDLSRFFENLSKTNQLVFTTHSPFLIDADKLDRVKAVYVDDNGYSSITSDLRSAAPKSVKEQSIYAAHAALGLTVSDVILQGCQPVLVEGPSDQHYLTAIRTALAQLGKFRSQREVIFVPAGGVRGVKAVGPILAAKEEILPVVVIDSDSSGRTFASQLKSEMYRGHETRVVELSTVTGIDNSEVEDLVPPKVLADCFNRLFRSDEDLQESLDESKAIVPQIESFARLNRIDLQLGWKVDLAKAVKRKILSNPSLLESSPGRLKALETLVSRLT